jgi:MoaA/NifB/PqqE/SkfB family radical SAM enzyme
MITAVITNGRRIARQPDLLDRLDEVVVSLDSVNSGLNDRFRGKGSHRSAIRTLELARKRNLKTYIVMVINNENFSEVEPMLDFCESSGYKLHAQPVTFGLHYTDEGARPLELSDHLIRDLHQNLAKWKRQRRPLMFSSSCYEKVLDWKDIRVLTRPSKGCSKCMAGRFYFHIEADGDIWPCQQFEADYTPKNLVRDGVKEALMHARYHNCGNCYSVYLNERKDLFRLRPSAVLEAIRRG